MQGGDPGHGCSELGNYLCQDLGDPGRVGSRNSPHCWTNKRWLVNSVDAN